MQLITSLTNAPKQNLTLTGIPGIQIQVALRFMPRIQIWNMDIMAGNFMTYGVPLLSSPNVLRQWRNIIPFGITVTNIYRLDPYSLDDFINGNTSIYLLNSDDVTAIESDIYKNYDFISPAIVGTAI